MTETQQPAFTTTPVVHDVGSSADTGHLPSPTIALRHSTVSLARPPTSDTALTGDDYAKSLALYVPSDNHHRQIKRAVRLTSAAAHQTHFYYYNATSYSLSGIPQSSLSNDYHLTQLLEPGGVRGFTSKKLQFIHQLRSHFTFPTSISLDTRLMGDVTEQAKRWICQYLMTRSVMLSTHVGYESFLQQRGDDFIQQVITWDLESLPMDAKELLAIAAASVLHPTR